MTNIIIPLKELADGDIEVIEIGDIRISGYLVNGKTVLTVNALKGGDFLLVQPDSANKVIIKADKTIKH